MTSEFMRRSKCGSVEDRGGSDELELSLPVLMPGSWSEDDASDDAGPGVPVVIRANKLSISDVWGGSSGVSWAGCCCCCRLRRDLVICVLRCVMNSFNGLQQRQQCFRESGKTHEMKGDMR